METVELTVHLLKENLEFAERYAREHRMTVTELIDRCIGGLRAHMGMEGMEMPVHPEVEAISGVVPSGVDAEALHREHLLRKHDQRSSSD